MAGVNKAIIVGNLGRDPEMRYMQDGTPVANLNIATSDEWKDKNTGEKRERTEWHRVVAFRRLAEICGQYLSKGRQVYIEGKIQTREWQDKDGNRRWTTEIVAQTMQMLGNRGDSSGRGAVGPPDEYPDYYHQGGPSQQDSGGYPGDSGGGYNSPGQGGSSSTPASGSGSAGSTGSYGSEDRYSDTEDSSSQSQEGQEPEDDDIPF